MRRLAGCVVFLAACTGNGPEKDDSNPPAPEVRFVVPLDGARFDPLERVPFCVDVVTGDAADATVSLSSDVDGVVSTGGLTPCEGGDLGGFVELSDAEHTLEFALTDAAGRVATASLLLVPTDNPSPTCLISQPAGEIVVSGTEVTLRAQVEDDVPATQLIASLSSDLDGVVWTGSPNRDGLVGASLALGVGEHRLVLSVEDPRGARGTCEARVTLGTCTDADGDGVDSCSGDCDDTSAEIGPHLPEEPNGIDDDCNGIVDDGTALYDDDGDGVTEVDGDCDDADAGRAPGLAEIPDDGIDQDCNNADAITCFLDVDRDGVGGTSTVVAVNGSCGSVGGALVDGDCDDSDGTVFPGAPEAPGDGIDQDCDGVDLFGCFVDDDGDGYGTTALVASADADCDDIGEALTSDDCDDTDADTNPGELDPPDDGVDQDCSGVDSTRCYADDDADGHGSPVVVVAPDGDCQDPGESTTADDCNDQDASVSPSAPEIGGDGIDQDCDGNDGLTCYLDADDDGVGGTTTLQSNDGDCDDPGESDWGDDCDDTDRSVFPGAVDTPDDGVDQDCSGVDAITCALDVDGDGIGGDDTVVSPDGDCASVGGTATRGDCDDDEAEVFPGAVEVRDGADNDCDGACDEGLLMEGDLVISELMVNPAAVVDDVGEWVEVYNPTNQPIGICDGWSMRDQGSDDVALSPFVVPAQGFAVLCAEGDPALNGGVSCDATYPYGSSGMQLSNSGDEVELWFDLLRLDAVVYPSSFDASGAAQAAMSPLSATANDNISAWCDAQTPLPGGDAGTPGSDNDCP